MDTDTLDSIEYQQLSLLIQTAGKTLAIGTCALCLAFWLFSGAIEFSLALTWFLAGIGLVVLRGAVLFKAARVRAEPGPLKFWCSLYVASLFLAGAHWGYAISFWDSQLSAAAQLQLFLFPIALCAGAVGGYGAWMPAYLAFTLPCLIPIVVLFITGGDAQFTHTAVPALLYLGGLLLLVRTYQRNLKESIILRLENEALVSNLSDQNKQLERAMGHAECASQAKSDFLATMSHEIRTPMNGVLGMTELMLASTLDDKQRHYGETVRDSAKSLLAIINDVLDFSKIEAGKFELERLVFDPVEPLRCVATLMQGVANDKDIELVVEVDDLHDCLVYGDALRLQQILTNLVSNAIKFTESGQVKMTLAAEQCSLTGDENIGTRAGWMLEYQVSDTGIGIDEAKQELIFAAFEQADGSTTRKFGGTGLGLAICRQLTGLMDGVLSVQSDPGKGSIFTLALALELAENSVVANCQSSGWQAGQTDLHGLNILLAEDSPVNTEVAVVMLESIGVSCVTVTNGQEAVEAVRQSLLAEENLLTSDASNPGVSNPQRDAIRFDLVLMDCQMPITDGYEATRMIRSLDIPGAGSLPIVALTANAMSGDREKCLDAGMNDYLTKPFVLTDLADMILACTYHQESFRKAA